MTRRRVSIVLAGLSTLNGCGPSSRPSPRMVPALVRPTPGVTHPPRLTDAQVVVSQTIYVPVYSTVATADNARSINLAVTLTIRNLDPTRPIELSAIRYHDSGGRLVRESLDRPLQVGPLASYNLFVQESDHSGGPTPSFLVDWAADVDVVAPLVEAVMISTAGSQGIALSSTGRVIANHHR